MKKSIAVISVALLSLLAPARPEEAVAPAFNLQNRSDFKGQEVKRDPFWPIGWVRPSTEGHSASPSDAVDFKPENFKLTSVLLGDPPLVVINGKEFTEGQVAKVAIGSQKVDITVLNIMDGAVRLQHRGQTIVIEMKRK